jgi:RND superfamily putative drug exporter
MATTTYPARPARPTGPADPPRRGLLERWGSFVHRRRWPVLAVAALVLVLAAAWGGSVFGALVGGGFEDPRSEAAQAEQVATDAFGHVGADVVVVYQAPEGSGLVVDDPAFATAARSALAAVPADAVTRVVDHWSTGDPAMVSADGRTTYAVLTLAGEDVEAREEVYVDQVEQALVADGLVTLRGGVVPTSTAINTQVEEDIAAAESLSIPILMVLLVLVFGSLAAAGLPLLIGGFAILGAFAALKVLTLVTDVSIFAVNLVIMLGLGLAIDYGLFMVARFREEIARLDATGNGSIEQALVRTLATAGRTVIVSGVTVALSLGALLLFPMNFLRSMGYGGIASVLVAMVAALTVLPAMLAVLGRRVDAWKVPWLGRRRIAAASRPADEGAWAAVARRVMKRPILVTVATAAVLLVLGAPFLRAAWGGVDARVLPSGTEARVASAELGEAFPGAASAPLSVVVQGGAPADVESFLDDVAALPDAAGVRVTAQEPGTVVAAVDYSGESTSSTATALVDQVRAVPAPEGATVLVGGPSAALVDLLDGLGDVLPWAALYLVVVTFLVLFMAFGSVVLPIKAIVMNLLSLTATFGLLVWGFQEGGLADLLGFTATGTLEATQPILILALAFGLSMDYEVFLLSRIREEWDRSGDNEKAVARGLQRSGGIITSAALLFVVVVGAFATSGIVFIQMIGIGLAVAVLIDATLVRALLVPGTMRLLGRANWWAPGPMLRFWERYGLRESSGDAFDDRTVPRVQDLPVPGVATR